MKVLRDSDIDPAPLEGKRIAILGYGNQGRAQALNLHDSGHDVVVGLREGSSSAAGAEAAGLQVASLEEAAASADLAMFLAPDEVLPELYAVVEPHLREGAAIGFSHGLAIHFRMIQPRGDVDVILVAPKGPGSALRSLYQDGKGMVALWAVAQDSSGGAAPLAQAYGSAIGCGRAGLIESTFAEECEADLFNEQAVVWGAVPQVLQMGYQTLVDAGVAPEVAFLECVGELKLIAELIEQRGLAGMREAISNTAELGAVLGGPRVIGEEVRTQMKAVLQDIRSGKFARELSKERESGYERLRRARDEAAGAEMESVFRRLRNLSAGD